MSKIPEIILQTIIVRGIRKFKTDDRFIDQLFMNTSRQDKQNIRDFVKNNAFDLSINYPRKDIALPAVVILLKGESEAQAYLSDSMGYQTPEEMSYDEEMPEVLGGTASVSGPVGEGAIAKGPFRILSSTNNTIRVSNNTFEVDDFVGKEYTLRVVGGTGRGQVRKIVANGHNFIMVDSNWIPRPDTTSILEVHKPDPEVIGEPEKLYTRRNPYSFIERKGSNYTLNYQLQVIGGSQEDTIYLYAIIKSIITLARTYLEGQGVINLRMNGSDFSNRPDYVPDIAYMRVLNLQFESPFDVYAPEEDIARVLELTLLDGNSEEIDSFVVDTTDFVPEISGP